MPQKKKKNNFSKHFLKIVKILVIVTFFLSLPGISVYQVPMLQSQPLAVGKLSPVSLYPQNINNLPFPKISAEGIFIVDLSSNVILYEKNSRLKFSPASTTKLMTALVSLEKYQLDEILEVKTVISEGRVMGLILGEKISAENLLYGTLVHSGNDAAYVLAENYPGGVAAFVDRMNTKAKELNLKDSHFTNPIGFEDDNHFTTAYDLAQIARIALLDNQIRKITSTKIISVSDKDFTNFHILENVNSLLGKYPGFPE